jgi:hypothetical protein
MFISWSDDIIHQTMVERGAETNKAWEDVWDEVMQAAPYLSIEEHGQAIVEGRAYLLFDTEEELMDHYRRTVGDDGPTELNSYKGPAHVYAITCNPEGQLEYENT